MKAEFLVAIGIITIIAVICFSVAWFNFVPGRDNMRYSLSIVPSSDDQFVLTIPTVIDRQGRDFMGVGNLTASRAAEISHVNTQYGRTMRVTSAGNLALKFECVDCSGDLSLKSGHPPSLMIHASAGSNFTIHISVYFAYEDLGNLEVNRFNWANGGSFHYKASAASSASSTASGTTLDSDEDRVIGDAFSMGTDEGVKYSIIGFAIGVALVIAGCVWSTTIKRKAICNFKEANGGRTTQEMIERKD